MPIERVDRPGESQEATGMKKKPWPEGVGSGKHFGSCYQDPTLACPTMSGRKFRTTLVKDGEQRFVMELCEPLESLIDLASEFHGYDGDRCIITVITTHERPPHVMGFRLMDDG
jgi:hypothetical protein